MNWVEMQKQYLDALQSFGQNFDTKPQGMNTGEPWMKAMEYWWQQNQPSMSSLNTNTFQKLMDESRNFYFMGQQLSQLLNQINASKASGDEWMSSLNSQIEQMKDFFSAQNITSTAPFAAAASYDLLNNPFIDTLKKSFAEMPTENPFMNMESMSPDWMNSMDPMLKMQPLGYSRETQEKLQKNVLLLKEFQIANQAYNEAMLNVSLQGLEKFKQAVIKKSESEEKIESLKQLYDLWVDCNEESYAEFTMTEEYSRLYGDMVNSLMAYKAQSNEIMEDSLRAINLPSKGDITALAEKQHTMSRRLRTAEKDAKAYAAHVNQLEKELDKVKTELKNLKAESSPSVTESKPKSKKKARKKTVEKEKVVDINSASAGKSQDKKLQENKSQDKKSEAKTEDNSKIEIKF